MLELVVIALCVLVNAVLSGVEMAFVSARRTQLSELAAKGNADARRVLALRDRPERTLSIIQIGITLVGAVAAAIGGAGAEETLNPFLESKLGLGEESAELVGILLLVLPLTYVSVVVGELIPKTVALKRPMKIVLRAGRWLTLVDRLLGPVVTVLEWSTKRLLGLFRRDVKESDEPSPEDASTGPLADEIANLSDRTRQYVINLVGIERTRVRDVLVPWSEVVAIAHTMSIDEVERVIIGSGHTRLPVRRADGSFGLLHTKEFLAFRVTGSQDWHSLIRPILTVAPADPLLRVLAVMQQGRSRMALVRTGGEPLGFVTFEDLIEQIVGDIYDEDDDGRIRKLIAASSRHRPRRPRESPTSD